MRTWTVGMKLMSAFGAMLALTLVLSYSALNSIGTMKKDFDSTVSRTALKRFLSAQLTTEASELASLERAIMVRMYMKDSAKVEQYKQDFRDTVARTEKKFSDMRALTDTETGRNLLDKAQQQFQEIPPMHEELMRSLASNMEQGVASYTAKFVPKVRDLQKSALEVGAHESASLKEAVARSEDNAAHSRWIAFLLLGISVLIGAVIMWIVRGITSQLRALASDMKEGAEQVASASGQVSASSQSLAQGASEQAASLEETSASSEEITSMTRKNAENSRSAASLTGQASELVATANQNLEQMVGSMKEINASSDKIARIIKVIDEIAFQTNILALNAAVEAARAGDAGMGFAVVADEVRNLAQRSAQAAKDTAALIEESIAKSNDGKNKLDLVAKAIHDITANVTQINTLVDEVKLGSEEQARGIEQISKAVGQMEQVTQKTAANAEESASASEELNAQAASMADAVTKLNAMVGGSLEGSGSAGPRGTQPAGRAVHAPAQHAGARLRSVAPKKSSAGEGAHTRTGVLTSAHPDAAIPLDQDFKEF